MNLIAKYSKSSNILKQQQSNIKVISKQYQPTNFCSEMNPEMQELKRKIVIRCQEMSIGVASVQQKEFTTASAVYYCEQRFAAENAVVVAVVVVRPSILAQCLASTSLEQYLSSGTASGFWNNVWYQDLWNNNGLTLDINR